MSTGIAYDDVRSMLGLVPEFEEREAAIASGYRWTKWLRLDMRDRAAAVAHYRIRGLISLHSQDAVDRAVDRRRRQAEARKKNK